MRKFLLLSFMGVIFLSSCSAPDDRANKQFAAIVNQVPNQLLVGQWSGQLNHESITLIMGAEGLGRLCSVQEQQPHWQKVKYSNDYIRAESGLNLRVMDYDSRHIQVILGRYDRTEFTLFADNQSVNAPEACRSHE